MATISTVRAAKPTAPDEVASRGAATKRAASGAWPPSVDYVTTAEVRSLGLTWTPEESQLGGIDEVAEQNGATREVSVSIGGWRSAVLLGAFADRFLLSSHAPQFTDVSREDRTFGCYIFARAICETRFTAISPSKASIMSRDTLRYHTPGPMPPEVQGARLRSSFCPTPQAFYMMRTFYQLPRTARWPYAGCELQAT
jgi:hypothetical protein